MAVFIFSFVFIPLIDLFSAALSMPVVAKAHTIINPILTAVFINFCLPHKDELQIRQEKVFSGKRRFYGRELCKTTNEPFLLYVRKESLS